MRKRGIEDFSKVQIDNWAVGQVAPQFQGKRLLRALSYFKGDADQLLRPADRRGRRARRHERGEGRRVHRQRRPSRCRRPVRSWTRSPPARVRRPSARYQPARRRQLHHHRPGDTLAEVALPLHHAPARRSRAAHGRLRGRRAPAADPLSRRRSPRWRCRTATRTRTGAGAAPSTSANTAWAGWPARSSRTPTRRRTRRCSTSTLCGRRRQAVRAAAGGRHLRARRRHAVEALRGLLRRRTSRAAPASS